MAKMEHPIEKLASPAATPDPAAPPPAKQRTGPLKILTALSLLMVSLMAVMAMGVSIKATSRNAQGEASPDFVEYWAAGQLLMHGNNPYDEAATLRLERGAGWNTQHPEITYSPPVVFVLVAPLGLVSAKVGAVLWLLLMVGTLLVSVRLLWIIQGRRSGQLHLLCFCFAPVLTCFMAGQIGIFLLLGIVLFLFLHKTWPFVAGASLLVCSVKPHLFFLFGIVLLLWVIERKQYRILMGAVVGLLAACVLTLCFDPHAFSEYARSIAVAKPTEPMVPTLSRMFRFVVHRDAVWLQFLPAVVGCGWAVRYFWKRRGNWEWNEQGLLLLVSVACAPYAWFTDEAVLLPAILAAIYRTEDSGLLVFGLINCFAMAELFKGLWITSPYFVWTVAAWIAWYLYAGYSGRLKSSPVEPGAECA